MTDSYKILISLSRHRVAFEYWQCGDEEIHPVGGVKWPSPLAVYFSPNGIVIGEEAERAAASGTANAFANYFDALAANATYTDNDITKPAGELLAEAAEAAFRSFFRDVLHKDGIKPEDYRESMDLTLIFESNINSSERIYVSNLFKERGYSHVAEQKFRDNLARFLRESLLKDYTARKVLVARAEGADLTFQLIDADENMSIVEKTYPGLGVDQRRKQVEDIIWEDIYSYNPYESREQNIAVIRHAADAYFKSSDQIVRGEILLTSGNSYRYQINRWQIDSTEGDGELRRVLDEFLAENGIDDRSNMLLLLRGDAASNPYFEQNLKGNFAQVLTGLRGRLMQFLVAPVKKAKAQSVTVVVKPDDFDPQAFIAALEKNRDRYQAAGNKRLFTMFSDIIRKTKAVEEYRVNLPKKRQSPHPEEIASIVQALEEYVSLCSKMKVDASAYSKTLDAYKALI